MREPKTFVVGDKGELTVTVGRYGLSAVMNVIAADKSRGVLPQLTLNFCVKGHDDVVTWVLTDESPARVGYPIPKEATLIGVDVLVQAVYPKAIGLFFSGIGFGENGSITSDHYAVELDLGIGKVRDLMPQQGE